MSFKNPSKECRAIPFWSLNGKLRSDELKRQIDIMEEMGFGGAFLHSRGGLETEYMSDEWMEYMRSSAEYLSSKGMSAWLYDEDRWPSGSCGGYVTQNQEYRQRSLSMRITNGELPTEFDSFVSAFAVKLEGDAYAGQTHLGKRLVDYMPVDSVEDIPDGYDVAYFGVEIDSPSGMYNGNTYLDTLDPRAVEEFIRLTHEKYKSALGDSFGREIKGIFTDEPYRGAVFNGFANGKKNWMAMLPWSNGIFEEYRNRWGEDIEKKLPELFFVLANCEFNRTSWRYIEIVQERFLKSFAKPYYDWCKKNGLFVTGHVWEENTLQAQTNWQGSVMRYYEYMDIPGIDNIRDNNYNFAAVLQVSSVAKQLGKSHVLSEMYGCTGWKTTLDYYKRSGDWQAALGINVRCPHLLWYTMGKESKRDCPASIFFQANWYKEYKYVEDYFARLNTVFDGSSHLTDTLLLTPIESAWGLIHGGYQAGSVRYEPFVRLEADWLSAVDKMVFAGVDFDIGDEGIMESYGSVSLVDGKPVLKIGEMTYSRVVLPSMINLRGATYKLLNSFADIGGKIYFLGKHPSFIDGEKSQAYLIGTETTPECLSAVYDSFAITYDNKDCILRKIKKATNGDIIIFLVNFSADIPAKIHLKAENDYNVLRLSLRDGEKYDANGIETFVLSGGEELLLRLTKSDTGGKTGTTENLAKYVPCVADFDYTLDEPNVLVLDTPKYYADGVYMGEDEVLHAELEILKKYGRSLVRTNGMQPWYMEIFHADEYFKPFCRVCLEYEITSNIYPRDAYIMAERNTDGIIKFNGTVLSESPDKPFISDICFTRYDIPAELWTVGKNKFTVEFSFSDSEHLEVAYLCGSFAVSENRAICEPPSRIKMKDLCAQGFPYYTGSITYKIPVPDGKYRISVKAHSAACLSTKECVCAFSPFELYASSNQGELELTAHLCRRNLFGPLHEIPKNHGNYWAGSFRTVGDKFSREYQINPQGFLDIPDIFLISDNKK